MSLDAQPDVIKTLTLPGQAIAVICTVLTACIALGLYLDLRPVVLAGMAALSTFLLLAGMASVLRLRRQPDASMRLRAARIALADDPLASVIIDASGDLNWWNDAAAESFAYNLQGARNIAHLLVEHVPNAASVTQRLMRYAAEHGQAEDLLIGHRKTVSLHVRQFGGAQLWRIALSARADGTAEAERPMLTIGRNGTILFMNAAAKALVGGRVKSLDRLFAKPLGDDGGPAMIMTTQGQRRVDVTIEKLQSDRSHIFLEPVLSAAGAGFALADLPVPLMRLSAKGRIEDANEAALSLLGYSSFADLALTDVFESLGDQIEEWLAKSLELSGFGATEFLRVKGAKKETFVQVALKRLGPTPEAGIIATLTDATKLKSLEAQFVQSQKMQAIGQLAGGVAHDFNNLLTAISGHCDLLLLRHDQGDQDYADLMQIHQNANRAASLVSQLLAFSRKQTLQPETLDLRETLSDLTHLLNRLVGERVKLRLSHDPALKAVRADKRQLEQVIMNLVVNARDAMPEGGEITVETESMTLTAPLKRERVTVPTGEYAVVRVRDQGTGIAPDALQKIFEPFYTTKRTGEGTGLGLSTAYGIVKQTGGFIFADSELGQGTSFSLLFPASERMEPGEERSAPPPVRAASGPSDGIVLLVEDEAPVRAFASRALRMRGFEVIEADSAETALQLLEDEALKVDVFVTDVVMPGMDGPTWVQQALRKRPDVKVIFVSGYAEGAFQGKKPEVANSVFLPKPFSLGELTSTVQAALT